MHVTTSNVPTKFEVDSFSFTVKRMFAIDRQIDRQRDVLKLMIENMCALYGPSKASFWVLQMFWQNESIQSASSFGDRYKSEVRMLVKILRNMIMSVNLCLSIRKLKRPVPQGKVNSLSKRH